MSTDSWLPSLQTATPQVGYELAIKLSRMAVKLTQPSDDIRRALRPIYEKDPDALIASSHVVAVHFATIAAANDYWRSLKGSA
jgi:Hexameric tyrosine-coordinated heme protein (HTHP)